MSLFAHKSGLYGDMPAEEYHSDPAVGSSTLKTLISKSPFHASLGSGGPAFAAASYGEAFHMAILEPARFETDVIRGPEDRRGNKWKDAIFAAASYGEAFHMAILEPARFETDVIRGPEDRRGNKWKDAIEEAGSKTLLTSGDYATCLAAQEVVMKSPTVRDLVQSKYAMAEASVFWYDEESGMRCKCRPDLLVKKTILDLKTASSIKFFDRDAFKFGYQIQQSHYVDGLDNQMDGGHEFLFIAVEKEHPFCWSIFEYDARSNLRAKAMWRVALNTWASCVKSGLFPSYPERQIMSLPDYAFTSMFDE